MVSPEKYPMHIKQNMGTARSTHDDRTETNAVVVAGKRAGKGRSRFR
jgi:hypothetical protein